MHILYIHLTYMYIYYYRLEEVMKSLVKDETSRMNEIYHNFLKIIDSHTTTTTITDNNNTDHITSNSITSNNITNSNSVDNDILQDELDELRDIIEQIDMAQIFTRFGGLQCLLNLLELNNDIINIDNKCSIASTLGYSYIHIIIIVIYDIKSSIYIQCICYFLYTIL